MKPIVRATILALFVASLVAASAAAMMTSHGPPSVVRLQRNVTRIDQRAFVTCTRNCSASQKAEVDACNALGSAFKTLRTARNVTAHPGATVGKCVSAAAIKLHDCKRQCKATRTTTG